MGPKRRFIAACWIALMFVVVGALPAEAALLPNGGFETGDFTEWTVDGSPEGDWVVYDDADLDFPSPLRGTYSAGTISNEPNHKVLYQEIQLPDHPMRLTFATAWSQPPEVDFCTPNTLDHVGPCNQQFRVDVMDVGSGATSTAVEDVLKTLHVTKVGAPSTKRPFTVKKSLKAFRGQTVVIRFAQVDNVAPLRVIVDRVKLERI